jgi:uncharacterized protein YkwD
MSPSSVTCPGCKAALRTNNPLPPGKSIKCPRCSVIFVVPGTAAGQQLQKPRTMPVPVSRPASAAGSKAQRAPASADGYEPDFRKPKGNGLLVATVCMAAAILLLGGGGAVAYLLLLKDDKPSQASSPTAAVAESPARTERAPTTTPIPPARTERATVRVPDPVRPPTLAVDPLAFIPPDSNLVAGVRQVPQLTALMQPLLKQNRLESEFFQAIGLEDIAEQTILGFKIRPEEMRGPELLPEEATLVIQSRTPFDIQRVQRGLGDGPAIKVKGKEYMPLKLNADEANPLKFAFVASDRVVVLSSLPPERLNALFAAATKPALDDDMVRRIRQVDKSQFWAVMAVNRRLRKEIEANLAALGENVPAEFQPALTSLKQAEAVAVWGGLEGKQLRLHLGIDCPDATAAAALSTAGTKLWQTVKPLTQQKMVKDQLQALPAYIQDLANDFVDNIKFNNQDTMAQVSVELRSEPLMTLVKAAQEKGGPEALLASLLQPKDPAKPPPQPAGNFAEAEKDLFTLMNEARDREKTAMFKLDPKLVQAARANSENLAKQPKDDKSDLAKRAADAGYKVRNINGYVLRGMAPVAGRQVYENIVNKDEARKIMLDKTYAEIGIAFVRNDKNEVYITIIVATPTK